MLVLVCVLIRLPANGLRKLRKMAQVMSPCHPSGRCKWNSWFHPSPAVAICTIWRVNEQMEEFSLCLPYNSDFQINDLEKKSNSFLLSGRMKTLTSFPLLESSCNPRLCLRLAGVHPAVFMAFGGSLPRGPETIKNQKSLSHWGCSEGEGNIAKYQQLRKVSREENLSSRRSCWRRR